MQSNIAGYTIKVQGFEIRCDTIAQVIEAVRAFEPLSETRARANDREVALPPASIERLRTEGENPVTLAIYTLYRENPEWRRPSEIIRALRKRGIPKRETQYARVYGALRHGDFVKHEGHWNLSDAV